MEILKEGLTNAYDGLETYDYSLDCNGCGCDECNCYDKEDVDIVCWGDGVTL